MEQTNATIAQTSVSVVAKESTDEMVVRATCNFTKILSTSEIKANYVELYWGGNGVGDRWARQKFNYSVIYSSKPPALYSENDDDEIPEELLTQFLQVNKELAQINKEKGKNKDKGVGVGIIGIFVHSRRSNVQKRPIDKVIHKDITSLSCVVCGTRNTICDHKNDLYNDERVLSLHTQVESDFQPLCNHCNLQKRQVCKTEEQTETLFSAKQIQRYKVYPFEFPWEKKVFDRSDIDCKTGTYWFDPVEFDKNIYYYSSYVIPIVNEIKRKVKANQLSLSL